MKYETPRLTALSPAINAVHGTPKDVSSHVDGPTFMESDGAYEDWE